MSKRISDNLRDNCVLKVLPDPTKIRDLSSKGLPLTLSGSVTITEIGDVHPYSIRFFNNLTDFVFVDDNITNGYLFDFDDRDFTIECRVQFVDVTNNFLISKWDSVTAANRGWLLEYDGSGIVFRYSTTGADVITISETLAASIGTWYHFAIVREAGNLTLFIDGVAGTPVAIASAINASTLELRIGQDSSGNVVGTPNYYIQDINIYNGVAKYTATFTPADSVSKLVADTSLAIQPLEDRYPYAYPKLQMGWLAGQGIITNDIGEVISWKSIKGDFNLNPVGDGAIIKFNGDVRCVTADVNVDHGLILNQATPVTSTTNLQMFVVGTAEIAGDLVRAAFANTISNENSIGIIYRENTGNREAISFVYDSSDYQQALISTADTPPFTTLTIGNFTNNAIWEVRENNGTPTAGPAQNVVLGIDTFALGLLNRGTTPLSSTGTYRAVLIYNNLTSAEIDLVANWLIARFGIVV